MQFHDVANIFPMMSAEEFDELKRDIQANGQLMPIWVYESKIVDGRNRYQACVDLGIEPVYQTVPGSPDMPALLTFVISLNEKRRHLNSGQKAFIALEVERLLAEDARKRQLAGKKIEPREYPALTTSELWTADQNRQQRAAWKKEIADSPTLLKDFNKVDRTSAAQAARIANTNMHYVVDAKKIEREAPELKAAVMAGTMTLPQATKELKVRERESKIQEQREAIASGKAELPEGVFEVIAIDPPWSYGRTYDPEGSRVANPYPEMTHQELMEVALPAANDAVLFLWTTHAFLWDAKKLLDHWGFTYKATLVWDKQQLGMGTWMRMQCEFCLVGIKGKPIWSNTTWRDIISEPRREHSRKPEAFYQFVESVTVGRRLEYFSRTKRQGWEVFGDEC